MPIPLQNIDGIDVYVVDFDTLPQLPITWDDEEEKPYAQALDIAIRGRLVAEPGKYAIHVYDANVAVNWMIFKIIEDHLVAP